MVPGDKRYLFEYKSQRLQGDCGVYRYCTYLPPWPSFPATDTGTPRNRRLLGPMTRLRSEREQLWQPQDRKSPPTLAGSGSLLARDHWHDDGRMRLDAVPKSAFAPGIAASATFKYPCWAVLLLARRCFCSRFCLVLPRRRQQEWRISHICCSIQQLWPSPLQPSSLHIQRQQDSPPHSSPVTGRSLWQRRNRSQRSMIPC